MFCSELEFFYKGHYRSRFAMAEKYQLRSRRRVTSAGSVRPHMGMEVRALPAVASQVTPSQEVAILDDECKKTSVL